MGVAIATFFEIDVEAEIETLVRDRAVPRPEHALHCAACGQRVTARSARVRVAGAHEHAFVNPHGIRFRIGCFDEAPGCAVHEPGTEAWTWFAGYEWRIGICVGCSAHLGWGYRAVADPGDAPGSFYGLILDRLSPPA